jgi:hypothetical protein
VRNDLRKPRIVVLLSESRERIDENLMAFR